MTNVRERSRAVSSGPEGPDQAVPSREDPLIESQLISCFVPFCWLSVAPY